MRFRYQHGPLLAVFLCWLPAYSLGQEAEVSLQEIRVLGDRLDHLLANSPAPTLVYGKNYFQSFEPQAVGDMLKRISGIAFTGDIGEFEAPQLRGLGSQYTQVLINGERIPGTSGDRTVLVDRIPAELIERIELVRSPTPDMDSQGIGGTLNLVLKDAASLQGTDWRLGGLYYPEMSSSPQGSAAITHGVKRGAWSYLVAANLQERLNPKTKHEKVFSGAGSLMRLTSAEDLRDSTDSALSTTIAYDLGDKAAFNFSLAYLDNQLNEDELIEILDGDIQADETAIEHRDINQRRLEFGMQYSRQLQHDMRLQLNMSGSRFDDDSNEQEAVLEEGLELLQLQQLTTVDDHEVQLTGSLSWQLASSHVLEVGAGISREDRDSRQTLLELEADELVDTSPGSSFSRVEETRAHAYLMDVWTLSSSATLEYGLRAEDTGLSQLGNDGKARESQLEFNPSAHLLYRVGDTGEFRASLARTLRRPGFDEIIPFSNRDTPDEDQVTVGNPGLQPEYAWGLDIGYAHRSMGNGGNLGVNLFYRKIEDKIELTRIGDDLFTPLNIGTGRTWGMELDFALPFTFINWPEVGVIGNYVWIDSRIKDPFSGQNRQFNLQPNYIANIDLFHELPALGLSHGLSWQKQGDVREFQTDEIKSVRYGSNLQYFIEKRLGTDLTIRLSVNNMLDARKREQGSLYQGLADLMGGVVDEVVLEREHGEPVFFFLTIRGSF